MGKIEIPAWVVYLLCFASGFFAHHAGSSQSEIIEMIDQAKELNLKIERLERMQAHELRRQLNLNTHIDSVLDSRITRGVEFENDSDMLRIIDSLYRTGLPIQN